MAKGVISLQKESGGIVKISPVDGIGVTELVVPESGNLVSVDTAVTDNAIARYDSTTGKLQNSGVVIDDNNNVGVGVTPSAWNSAIKNIQVGYGASLNSPSSTETILGANYYRNSSDINTYINNGQASKYHQSSGIHQWYTAPSGTAGNAITWTNAMTLDASGNLLVGTATLGSGSQNGFSIGNVSNTTYTSTNHSNGTGSTAWYSNFSYNGTTIGTISQSGTTAVSYNTTSDYRLKENIRPSDCKRFMDIKFVDYERIDGRHECGVIAHELQEIYPDLVIGEKDATELRKIELTPAIKEVKDKDGNVIVEAVEATYEEQEFPVYQQVNYIGLIARIGTVVQQQAKLIEAMQLEINELKGI